MHAISEGTVYVFYTSIMLNVLLAAYIITGITDKEKSN